MGLTKNSVGSNAADSEIAFYVSPDGSNTNDGSLRSPFMFKPPL